MNVYNFSQRNSDELLNTKRKRSGTKLVARETQTVNPAISPRNNARIGGFRKRKFVLSPGRKESQTLIDNELKSSKVNAKVIEVVIKSEPEDTRQDGSARLFYPVDISCGHCPFDTGRASTTVNGIPSKDKIFDKCDMKRLDCTENALDYSYAQNPDSSVNHSKTISEKESFPYSYNNSKSKIPYDSPDVALESSSRRKLRFTVKTAENFTCSSCRKCFSSATSLWDHVISENSCPNPENVICSFCRQRCKSRSNLLYHINWVHGLLRCESCDKVLPSSNIKEHMHAHSLARWPQLTANQCSLCDFSHHRPDIVTGFHAYKHFKNTGILNEYSLSNSFLCNNCGKTFDRRVVFVSHRNRCLRKKRSHFAKKSRL